MNSKILAAAALTTALSACATVPAAGTEPAAIVYETGPCFGACPVYRVTVSADGQGLFEGRRYTAVTGERRFTVTPDQYRRFAAQLAPVRPASGTVRYAGEMCSRTATDMPSVDITWRSGGAEQRLYFYYGCDMERNRALGERLRAAPALLPIAEMIRVR
jgi:hypothetical protein